MVTAGYSGTPLIKKLGIRPEMKVLLVRAPDNYNDLLGSDISGQHSLKTDTPDFVHLFAINKKIFESEMKKLRKFYKKNPRLVIWVSWYKKSSAIPTDITEDTIRNYALKNGLVDIKVCAVSESWSGLKLVVPIAQR